MTSNKTRCFQVVPVPGVFNRGRWECYDFIEGEDNTSETKENNDLLATEKNSASVPTNSTTTNVSAETINVVAIDNKIEQAMDLVKTHLTFAVREQVENLRSRIMELESKVLHLEAENNVLREHVPADILQSLSIQSTSSSANHRSNNTTS